MKELQYFATVTDTGKISVPRRMEQEVGEKFKGQRIEITFRKKKKHRSSEQNRYYWGVVIPYILEAFIELGNDLQDDAFDNLYDLEYMVKAINDPDMQRDWKYLQTSDHFYYMCTKFFADGDVHKYFNPYNTPYEAFINFMNILTDFSLRVKAKYAELQMAPPPDKPKRTKSAKKA